MDRASSSVWRSRARSATSAPLCAIFLAIATGLEVATYFWEDASPRTLAAVLLPIMVIKFAVVAGYFMHLKFDSPLFTRMFGAGLAFAVGVYSVMLTAFRFW